MCVRVLGDKTRLDEDIRTRIAELEEATKNNDGLHFQIAINYGGRDEIVRAVKKLSAKVQSGEVDPAGITADTLEGYLDTVGIPDPDLLILDDIENDENVRTPEQRAKLDSWFKKAVSKAGDDYTDIVYIGTLLHYDSLLANTLKNPGYKAIKYRACLLYTSDAADEL